MSEFTTLGENNMSKPWIEEVFGCRKPIIGMCHLNALPGDPSFDKKQGMKDVLEWAHRDLLALQGGGIDAVMFSNEFSLPYLTRVETVTAAAMARIIGELMDDIRVPFGVNVLWDPAASLDVARSKVNGPWITMSSNFFIAWGMLIVVVSLFA